MNKKNIKKIIIWTSILILIILTLFFINLKSSNNKELSECDKLLGECNTEEICKLKENFIYIKTEDCKNKKICCFRFK